MTAFTDQGVDGYFTGIPLRCAAAACRASHSQWDIVLSEIAEPFMWGLYGPLGAITSYYEAKLFRDRAVHLDLYEHGLPRNAVVLDVNFTGHGLFCHETTGNSRRQRRRDGRLNYSGHTTPNLPNAPDESKVGIAVTWVLSSDSDFAWNNLVSAFDAYADGNWNDAIIPANVAVENRMHQFISQELASTTSHDRLKDFLGNAATYSHQLNVLLPYITKGRKLPSIDDRLRGELNRLRAMRNDIAHRGYAERLAKAECASVLTAALFGFRYINWLRQQLAGATP
jgi:hypothetical protein